jgi:hypothetical protein
MLNVHGFLLLIVVGTGRIVTAVLPELARRIGDSHHVLEDIAQM